MSSESGCPFTGGGQKLTARHKPSNRDWWPKSLDIGMLHNNSSKSNPLGPDFDPRVYLPFQV